MTLAQVNIPIPSVVQDNKFFINTNDFVANLLSKLLIYSIILGGLIFMFRFISAGFVYMGSIGDKAKIEAALREITNALIGLIVIVVTFFAIQIIEQAFGINIL